MIQSLLHLRCAAQVAFLWAGMVSDEMGRQAAAGDGSADPYSCSTGSGAQEAAAAAVAHGMLSEFASEFGELLAGLAAVPERRAHMLAYLQANSMHACQRLLTSSSAASGGLLLRALGDSMAARQAHPGDGAAPPSGASREQAAGVTGTAPGRRLRLQDVLLGFAACLALLLGVLIAAGLELPAPRSWLAALRPAAAPVWAAGPTHDR